VALAAIKGEQTLPELAQQFALQPHQVTASKAQAQARHGNGRPRLR
jgi:hypothetical protein